MASTAEKKQREKNCSTTKRKKKRRQTKNKQTEIRKNLYSIQFPRELNIDHSWFPSARTAYTLNMCIYIYIENIGENLFVSYKCVRHYWRGNHFHSVVLGGIAVCQSTRFSRLDFLIWIFNFSPFCLSLVCDAYISRVYREIYCKIHKSDWNISE